MSLADTRISALLDGKEPDDILHYGIKDMKWGIRRFQDKAGRYTEEGKRRYGRGGDGERKGKSAKQDPSAARKDWKPGDASSLSDEELNRRNSRLQREAQYKQMTENQTKKFLKDAAKQIFATAAVTAAAALMKKYYKGKMESGASFLSGANLNQVSVSDVIGRSGDVVARSFKRVAATAAT